MRKFCKTFWRNRTLLLMLLPALALVFVFAYIPMGGVILAFKDFNFVDGIFKSPWAGLSNFRFFFVSGDAWKTTRNTFLYNIAFLTVNTSLQLLFAILLSEIGGKLFKKLAQGFMFLPHFISWVIVGAIAYNLFNYENGAVNAFLKLLGAEPVNVYKNVMAWPVIIVFFSAWKSVGYGSVVYLASIVGVDTEMNEAASIDGANIFQRIWYITLPSILPTIVILTLLAIGKIFRGDFGLFYQLIGNNGALYDVTDIIDTYVFRALLNSTRMGMSAAVGFYQSVLCFITIMLTNAAVKRIQPDYSLF